MFSSRLHILGILGFTLSWLAYDHYRPWVNFHSEALALFGISLMVLSHFFRKNNSIAFAPKIFVWIAISSLIPWAQYFADIIHYSGDALITSLYLYGFGFSIWLGQQYSSSQESNRTALASIFYSILIAALISAAIGLLQWLSLQDFLQMYVVQTDAGDRAMGNMGQPNQLATLLLMGMAALAWTFEKNRIGYLGFGIGVFFMTLVLVLTQSRSGMLSACFLAIFFIWKNQKSPTKIINKWIFFWIAPYIAACFFLPKISNLLMMGSTRSINPTIDNARIIIWKQVVSGIHQSPWWGYGWNQTTAAHAAGSLDVAGYLPYTYAHNIILDILAWNGLPFGIILTTLTAYWFISRIYRSKESTAIYALACIIPIAMHSMVEYPFAYSYFLLSAGLMIGIVESCEIEKNFVKINLNFFRATVVLAISIGCCVAYEYLKIEEDFRTVRFENLKIGQTPEEYIQPNVWMLSQLGSMLSASRLQAQPNMSDSEIENLKTSSIRFLYGNLSFRYAVALGLNGDPEGASIQMALIKRIYGDFYYHATVHTLREMEKEKYPELSKISTP